STPTVHFPPEAPSIEGRCSIRLSYGRSSSVPGPADPPSATAPAGRTWSGQRDSNPRPSAPKADALPDCAMPRPIAVETPRTDTMLGADPSKRQTRRSRGAIPRPPSLRPATRAAFRHTTLRHEEWPCENPRLSRPEHRMAAEIIDGKAIARALRGEVAAKIKERVAKGLRPPGLAVILVGNDSAS